MVSKGGPNQKDTAPHCSHLPLCPSQKKLDTLKGVGERLNYLLILPHARLGPHNLPFPLTAPTPLSNPKAFATFDSLRGSGKTFQGVERQRTLEPYRVRWWYPTLRTLQFDCTHTELSFRPGECFQLLRILFVASIWDSPGLDLWDNICPLRNPENCI